MLSLIEHSIQWECHSLQVTKLIVPNYFHEKIFCSSLNLMTITKQYQCDSTQLKLTLVVFSLYNLSIQFKNVNNSLFFLGSMLPQYMAFSVMLRFVCKKKIQTTSKEGRRLRFGILIALTNIRSTKVLHHASCIMHQASQATSKQGRRLRFGMLTVLSNIRTTKV